MRLTLYTWQYCPFAQRSRIALAVKGVEHDTYELDITRKPYPDWFMELSPNGKVPTLVHDGRPLYESQVISEYIDEVFEGPRLLPEDPYHRAISRLLITYGEDNFIPVLYRLLRSQEESRDEELKEEALEYWRWFNERLREFGSDSGLLFDEPTLADYSFGPFFQRWKLVEYYRYFEVPQTEEYARVRSWREAAEALKVVRDTAPPSEELIKVYADYARDYDNARIPPGRDISSFDTEAWPVEDRPLPPRGLRLDRDD
ncbi:glutathione S-transferase family protein [Microbulbifer yueqingensis]|uniref:Glutathione S-transferase n=1 Tax=Microbulbifer yueqingensis TaxID=658219 RepID=A0A1G8WUS1_9GAMM|nr:glutathione S-transferase family protein [Microbulbifer yueqingensis]SDJ82139.1 glutathione S-transferase [Microbulbifer yueqingensis]